MENMLEANFIKDCTALEFYGWHLGFVIRNILHKWKNARDIFQSLAFYKS